MSRWNIVQGCTRFWTKWNVFLFSLIKRGIYYKCKVCILRRFFYWGSNAKNCIFNTALVICVTFSYTTNWVYVPSWMVCDGFSFSYRSQLFEFNIKLTRNTSERNKITPREIIKRRLSFKILLLLLYSVHSIIPLGRDNELAHF